MVDPTTANIGLAVPTRGSDAGTWDVPVNGNSTILDAALGGVLTIGLNNTNVVLSSAQFIYKNITFNSTLTGSVNITFPSTFLKSYEVYNTCTGSSAFTISLVAGSTSAGQIVCCPPGETVEVYNDGSNIRFKNLGRIGSYWDYAGSSVPGWVSGCTIPPYLNCDGSTFSATTYPALATILGSTTLPNSKGRTRFALDQGAGLISTAATGFTTPNVGGTGGGMTTTLGTSNLPPYTPSGSGSASIAGSNSAGSFQNQFAFGNGSVASLSFGVSLSMNAQGGVSQAMTNLSPSYIGGLTLIRAA